MSQFKVGDMIVEDINFGRPAYHLILEIAGGDKYKQYLLQPLFEWQEEPPYYEGVKFIETHYKKLEP